MTAEPNPAAHPTDLHVGKLIRAYRLAAESMGSEDGEAIPFVEDSPQRPNPVTQGEMDAGSVELF